MQSKYFLLILGAAECLFGELQVTHSTPHWGLWLRLECRLKDSISIIASNAVAWPAPSFSAIGFECKGLATSLASLKTLSISYSDRIINVRNEDIGDTGDSADEIDHDASAVDDFREDDDIEVEACDEANFLGLARLLKLCSGLENLELDHYAIPLDGYPYFDLHRGMFLQHIVVTVQLPKLQRCTLRGLRAREVDLLQFLKKSTPAIKDFQMDMVRLASGTFSSILNYCTSEHAGLERLYFNDLFAPGELKHAYYDRDSGKPRLINFDGPCSNMLDRIGPEVRRPIVYSFPRYRRMTRDQSGL